MITRFKDVQNASKINQVTIYVDGAPREVASGISLAAALLRDGLLTLRTHPVTQMRRAPYCLMGVCFECLLKVDGLQQRACMVMVKSDMEVKTQ
ncbi:2Fe-2S iron-sulfur cluster protein [Advenella incenata]|jgi:predicted molibdopterin-dependent oxidoreductase YjgC|uniref:2Fe-2S iron-sulfur cluster protein n=1 Tax=Advenella incenata TaxID=267800 RepID=A0A4Q7VPC6_9BURK|nr:(2Fe-2S)-binding protein [Advenella incenata]RZT98276.1 2Fe-2S iron-sulfur cluster protein [Advenella incenata]